MFLKQSIIALLAKLGTMACLFVINGRLFRSMSLNEFGLWSLGFGLIPFMMLFDFGIGYWFQNQVLRPAIGNVNRALLFFGILGVQLVLAIFLISTFTFISLFFALSIPGGFIYFVYLIFMAGLLSVGDRYLASQGFNHFQELQQFVIFLLFTLSLFSSVSDALLVDAEGLALLFLCIYIIVKGTVLLSVAFFQAKFIDPFCDFEISIEKFFYFLKKGKGFFSAQVWALFFYNIDRYMVAKIYGASEVALYEPVYRYCSIVLALSMVFYRPLWSDLTRSNLKWVAYLKSISRLIKISGYSFLLLAIMMVLVSKIALMVWLGSGFEFSLSNLVLIMSNTILCVFIVLISFILNGMDKPKAQSVGFTAAIFVKLSGMIWLLFVGTNKIAGYLSVSLVATVVCLLIMIKALQDNKYA
jgi:O-antigen/teichoic acid export membrane protein